jgi:hypothetical protein
MSPSKNLATLPSLQLIPIRIQQTILLRSLEPKPFMFSADELRSDVLGETQVLFRWHDAESIGVTHATSPALHTDDGVATGEDTELDGVHDAPLETLVDIFLPRGLIEVRLLFVEEERVHSAVEMGILCQKLAKRYLRIMLFRVSLTLAARAFRVTIMIGQTGRYLESRRAVLPLGTS